MDFDPFSFRARRFSLLIESTSPAPWRTKRREKSVVVVVTHRVKFSLDFDD